ncbi:MAG: hypothetical protein DRI34_08845 [Deltaproteobacteria bacterium]|nr:MAG: hypothetical protein DRI34_08845 [Deltaproteobacteria bacterium]
MGHLATKAGYRRLRERLDRMPVGAPGRTTIYEILQILYSPAEAELAAQVPMRPTSAEALARRLGRPLEQLRQQLEALADKGLVLDLFLGGKMRYALAPTIVGLFEFSMMRVREDIDQKKLAGLLHRYLLEERDFVDSFNRSAETSLFRTLVHEQSLPADFAEVLDWERASHLVEHAGRWAVSLCHCRHVAHHRGHDCDRFRLESCLSLGAGADYVARHGLGRAIEKEQALALITETREAGLVHIADNVKHRPTFLCSCCGCCCEILQGFKRFRWLGDTFTSNYLARPDPAACTGCRQCLQACPVEAITMEESPHVIDGKRYRLRARVDESICLGCGVCALQCQYGSMHMQARPQRRIPPESTFVRVMSMAIEQGKLHHLLAETLPGWSGQLASALVGAIMRLPPARQLLARRELKSRFIDYALRNARKRKMQEVDL